MTDPIIFISRNRVKVGMLDDFKNHYLNSIRPIETGKPDTWIQLAYVNQNTTEVDIIRLFPDAEAMDQQLKGADERSKVAYQFIEPTSVEIYGIPSEFAMEMMQKVAGAGINVSIHPEFIGGFIRSRAIQFSSTISQVGVSK